MQGHQNIQNTLKRKKRTDTQYDNKARLDGPRTGKLKVATRNVRGIAEKNKFIISKLFLFFNITPLNTNTFIPAVLQRHYPVPLVVLRKICKIPFYSCNRLSIFVKTLQALFRDFHVSAFLICFEQARHPSCAKLFHIQFFMQNIFYTFF